MASGDTLLILTPLHNEPPASAGATFDIRNRHPVLDFDSASAESAYFTSVLPRNYGGSGISINLMWAATSGTTGWAVWSTAIERIKDNDLDIDANSFATVSLASGEANAASGKLTYSLSTHTDGAQMDGLLVGELFRLQVARVPSHATDTLAFDTELAGIEIKET